MVDRVTRRSTKKKINDSGWFLLKSYIVVLALVSQAVLAWSQPTVDSNEMLRQQQNIIWQQEEERQREFQRLQSQSLTDPLIKLNPKSEIPTSKESASFPIKEIQLEGADTLSLLEQQSLISPFIGTCMTVADINKLAQEITNFYIQQGYSTTRVYIPTQNLNEGILRLKIIEGFIETIQLPEDYKERLELTTAFPFIKGKILNIKDLEQGLDQLNRLPSNKATLKLLPGKKVGGSVVQIDNNPSKPWRLKTGVDNGGSKATGLYLGYITAEADNILGVNDFWLFTTKRVATPLSQQEDSFSQRSDNKSYYGLFSVPYGYWTLFYQGNYFDYLNEVQGLNRTFDSTGYSRTNQVSLDRVVYRGSTGRTSIGASFKAKDVQNQFEQITLATSSQKMRILSLYTNHMQRFAGGLVTAQLDLEKGLTTLGATNEEDIPDGLASPDFTKIIYRLAYNYPLVLQGLKSTFRSSLYGQWSANPLFFSEQLFIGGEYSVRGFKNKGLSGDKGAYLRTEIFFDLPETGSNVIDNFLGTVKPFVGYDIGYVAPAEKNFLEDGSLQGIAVGLCINGRYGDANITWAHGVDAPANFGKLSDEIYISTSVTF